LLSIIWDAKEITRGRGTYLIRTGEESLSKCTTDPKKANIRRYKLQEITNKIETKHFS
jgi:hypothetical protein